MSIQLGVAHPRRYTDPCNSPKRTKLLSRSAMEGVTGDLPSLAPFGDDMNMLYPARYTLQKVDVTH
jgi:hypothetical protein